MPQKKVRVLIAEDDYLVREVIQDTLDNIGHVTIGKAGDGQQAVDLTQSLQPDVVLMDIQMPVMDGLEASRHIYESCPTPVVVLTAYETPELVEQAGIIGVGAYLTKPPRARELERAIAISIARFADMMELHRVNAEMKARNQELQEALDKVKVLSGMLPICAHCKKIRNDEGYWQDVAVYIRNHSEAEFTHGLCPNCVQEHYPDFSDE